MVEKKIADVRQPVTVALMVAALVAGAGLARDARAQDRQPADEELQELVVTGSRIIREGMASPTPVTSLSSDELLQNNPQSLSQALATLPSMASSITPKGGSRTTLGVGSFLNLRNLGSNRNLVLLDGRRLVPVNIAGNTDVNMMPQGLISGVNVVTGGASAAYGSDAVAGVTNFMLNTRFEGVKVDLNGGVSAHDADGASTRLALAWGAPVGERLHLIASFDWRHSEEAYYTNRSWANRHCGIVPIPGVTAANMSPTNPRQTIACGVTMPNASNGGAIISGPLVTPQQGIDFGPGGVPRPFVYGSLRSNTLQVGGQGNLVADSINFFTPIDNQVFFGHALYEISDNVEAFVQGTFSRAESSYPQTPAYFYTPTPLTIFSGNPFIPATIQQRMTALNVPSFDLQIIPKSWGNIELESKYQTWDVVGGLKGKFGDGWSWDVHYERGRSTFDLKYPNHISWERLYRSIDAVVGTNGAITCRSALTNAAYSNCVPLNPFGEGSPSQGALDYIHGVPWNTNVVVQDDVAANLNGDLFATWAGPISWGVGAEWRRLQGEVTSDAASYSPVDFTGVRGLPVSLQGKIGDWVTNNVLPIDGSSTVKEGYVETLLPLARDLTFARVIDLNGAFRVTDYSQSGRVETWKLGLTWRPIDELLLRGTRSRDIRAPNLGDLYTKDSTGPNANVIDRVNGGNQSVSVRTILSGNPELKPEIADTVTYGFTYQPGWLTGLGLSVDYYDIQITDALASVGAQETVDRCARGQQLYCANVLRTGNTIVAVRSPTVNLSEARTRGVDIDLQYRTNLLGTQSTFRLVGTKLLEQSNTVPNATGATYTDRKGDMSLGNAEWIVLAIANVDIGQLGFNATGRYIDGGPYNTTYLPGDIDPAFAKVGSTFTLDVGARYGFEGRGKPELYLNVANVFDHSPPLIPSASLIGVQTSPNLYDTIGRYYTLGVRAQF